MMEWEELSQADQDECLLKAWEYYDRHTGHVNELLRFAERPIAPSGSDMGRPELWKGIHWFWLTETYSEMKDAE